MYIRAGPRVSHYPQSMPCLLVLAIAMFPRLVLILTWFFSTMLQRAYHDMVIPVIGFVFLPITTFVYAWMVTSHMRIDGINLVILIIAVLMDAGGHGSGRQYYRNRRD